MATKYKIEAGLGKFEFCIVDENDELVIDSVSGKPVDGIFGRLAAKKIAKEYNTGIRKAQ